MPTSSFFTSTAYSTMLFRRRRLFCLYSTRLCCMSWDDAAHFLFCCSTTKARVKLSSTWQSSQSQFKSMSINVKSLFNCENELRIKDQIEASLWTDFSWEVINYWLCPKKKTIYQIFPSCSSTLSFAVPDRVCWYQITLYLYCVTFTFHSWISSERSNSSWWLNNIKKTHERLKHEKCNFINC